VGEVAPCLEEGKLCPLIAARIITLAAGLACLPAAVALLRPEMSDALSAALALAATLLFSSKVLAIAWGAAHFGIRGAARRFVAAGSL
jgi:hypothetical protein